MPSRKRLAGAADLAGVFAAIACRLWWWNPQQSLLPNRPHPMIDIPTERTTAATDLLLAIVALGCVWLLWRCRSHDPWKAKLWASAFAMLVVASSLGSVAHGLKMPTEINRLL